MTELERLVRYCHPAKILATTRLPGVAALDEEVVARLYGASAARYVALERDLRRQARAAAEALSGRPAIQAAVGALRFRPGERILAVGDSHTDDLASWAEILGHLLPVPVVNAGLSGDTTTAALARLDRVPAATVAIVLLGTNDARRHAPGPMLVSHAETERNVAALDAALRRRYADTLWVTPPPVDEQRIRDDPVLGAAGLAWRLDDVATKAALVRTTVEAVVDLWPGFTREHLAADGLHPSAAGQRLIAERVVTQLARRFGPGGRAV